MSENVETVLGILLLLGIIGLTVYFVKVGYPRIRERKRIELKIRMSDPILRADIEFLQSSKSKMLDEAIALRRSQLATGRHPEAQQQV